MILKIDKGINDVNLSHLSPYINWVSGDAFFPSEIGKNHHILIAYLTSQLPEGSFVADFGTNFGASALAFASNPDVTVYTYDLEDYFPSEGLTCKSLKNVRFVKGDCIKHLHLFSNTSIILLDIAPHDGYQEKIVLEGLKKNDYKGIVICDDIDYSDAMRDFWTAVNYKKMDVTKYGHWSGTGIIVFDPNTIDVVVI